MEELMRQLRFPRLNKWVRRMALVFVISTPIFFGAGAYAVWYSNQERNDICGEVQDLRDDLVEVVRDGRDRGNKTADAFPPKQKKVILEANEESYKNSVKKIAEPSCPGENPEKRGQDK